MEALKKTLFIIALISVTSYTIRHIYLKWIEPRTSVLDQYDTTTTSEIKKVTSLKQLEELYANNHRKVVAADLNDSIQSKEPYQRMEMEPYKTESELREAIVSWEQKSEEIFRIRFYWAIGFVLSLIGYGLYKRMNPWLGITVIITGFAEMVYWTSPTFWGSGLEYENLLTNKIVLSIVTLILVIVAGFLTGTLKPAHNITDTK